MDFEFFAKTMIAGGVAGMTSKTAVAPLDRLKILFQGQNNHYKDFGVFNGLRGIFEKERMVGLYRGNGAQMVRVFPYSAIQFVSFEIYKKNLIKRTGFSHKIKAVAGSMAGITATIMTYPLDLARARIAFNVALASSDSKAPVERLTIVHTLKHVVKNEGGYRALYKGLTPTVIAMIPYSGLTFYCFERSKHLLLQYAPNYTAQVKNDKLVLNWYFKLFCGAISGAIAHPFSYPFDVARRRMQLSMQDPKTYKYSKNLMTTFTLVYREYGIVRGLYRGMSINYIRAVPMAAVTFTAYEIMKQFFNMDTGIE